MVTAQIDTHITYYGFLFFLSSNTNQQSHMNCFKSLKEDLVNCIINWKITKTGKKCYKIVTKKTWLTEVNYSLAKTS